jgi:hypothetical protein
MNFNFYMFILKKKKKKNWSNKIGKYDLKYN